MGKRRYAKPEITVLIAEPEGMLAASGRAGDTFHNSLAINNKVAVFLIEKQKMSKI